MKYLYMQDDAITGPNPGMDLMILACRDRFSPLEISSSILLSSKAIDLSIPISTGTVTPSISTYKSPSTKPFYSFNSKAILARLRTNLSLWDIRIAPEGSHILIFR
ncbi:MAG: hypothetical protein ACI94Y_001117 [Maribacter sp.]|jgi:hypothetical protein